MYKKIKTLPVHLVFLSATGCSLSQVVNKTLSPPADTKWVNVEINNPSQYTKPFPLEARYISHECLKKRVSGVDGSTITESNTNVINVHLQQEVEA